MYLYINHLTGDVKMDELSTMMMRGASYAEIRHYIDKKIQEAYVNGVQHGEAMMAKHIEPIIKGKVPQRG
jgi:hypothetical protein